LAPRIKIKVDDWDPVTDPVPIETWLHPWHAIMGDRLLHTYATLRQKLAKGLNSWLPGDRRFGILWIFYTHSYAVRIH